MTRQTKDNGKSGNQTATRVITVDYDLYAHYLADTDLSEEQKLEFLQTLWNIICEFVALGFEVHPAQQAKNACGELPIQLANPPILGGDSVELAGKILDKQFKDAAHGDRPRAAERIPE